MSLRIFPTHQRMHLVSALVMMLAIGWLALEHVLRGEPRVPRVTASTAWLVAFGCLGALWGTCVKARSSIKGEFKVHAEMFLVALMALLVWPASMCVLYAVAFILSNVLVALSWVLWGLSWALAWVPTLVFWAMVPLVFALMVRASSNNDIWSGERVVGRLVAGGACLICYYLAVTWIASKIVGRSVGYDEVFGNVLPDWVMGHQSIIPDWFFLFDALRETCTPIPLGEIITTMAICGIGILVALSSGFFVRRVRHFLMGEPTLRPYLPLCSAPLQDNEPLFTTKMLLPLTVHLSVVWSALTIWQVMA